MAHHGHHDKIVEPKRLEIPRGFTTACMALAILGGVTFLGALFAYDSVVAWKGFIIGMWFTLGFGLYGPFFAATQHLPRAGWSVSLRRIAEAFGWYIPVVGVLAIIGALVIPDTVFLWQHPDAASDPILAKKLGFLNKSGFILSTVLCFVGCTFVFYLMRKFSLAQDEAKGGAEVYALSNKLKATSAIYLISFAITVSFLSWYWLMSLEPNWFSTMFSVYTFAGMFQSGLALTYILMIYLGRKGYFGSFLGGRQVHDLGKMVFGFTVFYAYIGFCQFLLIWYANIPEEDVWYLQRLTDDWVLFTLALPFIKFIIPFLIMLPQKIKKNKDNVMYYLCFWLIATQLYEVWYWVEPQPHGINTGGGHALHADHGFSLLHAVVEIVIALGFVGLLGIIVSKALASRNLVPTRDPYLHETLPHFTHEVPLMGGAYDKTL